MQIVSKHAYDRLPFHHGATRTLTTNVWVSSNGDLYRTKHEREVHPTLTGIDWHVGTLHRLTPEGDPVGAPLFTKHVRMASTTDMHRALLAEIPE